MDPGTPDDVASAIDTRPEPPQPLAPRPEVTMGPSVVSCDPYPSEMLLRETKLDVPSRGYGVEDNQPDGGRTLASNMAGRISGSEQAMQPLSGEGNSCFSITPLIPRTTKVKPPPTWLPDDWYYEDIERKSGRSIGKIDRVLLWTHHLISWRYSSYVLINFLSILFYSFMFLSLR